MLLHYSSSKPAAKHHNISTRQCLAFITEVKLPFPHRSNCQQVAKARALKCTDSRREPPSGGYARLEVKKQNSTPRSKSVCLVMMQSTSGYDPN